MPGEANAAQGGGGGSAGGSGRPPRRLREVRRREGAGDGRAAVPRSGGVRGVRRPRADGGAAGEDNTEDLGARDGVRGGGAAGAVLGVGAVPEGGGGGGGADSAAAVGAERLHGEGEEEGAAAAEAASGFVATRFHRKF